MCRALTRDDDVPRRQAMNRKKRFCENHLMLIIFFLLSLLARSFSLFSLAMLACWLLRRIKKVNIQCSQSLRLKRKVFIAILNNFIICHEKDIARIRKKKLFRVIFEVKHLKIKILKLIFISSRAIL